MEVKLKNRMKQWFAIEQNRRRRRWSDIEMIRTEWNLGIRAYK